MRNLARSAVVTALAAAGAVLVAPTAAQAAPSTVGYDVSYPQCGTDLPTGQAFAVIGVNGGTAVKPNPCLSTQLRWAATSSGAVAAQPEVQLYVNTANPGQVRGQVTTWPTSGRNRYGTCDGDNSTACSYEYGAERVADSVEAYFAPAAEATGLDPDPGRYTWWLDVETGNTWQTGGSAALARNRAALEGMADTLAATGARVGIYSTGSQWRQIAGTVPPTSSLSPLPSWLAGSTTLTGAILTCGKSPLTRGPVVLSQYVPGDLDRNRSCS